MGPCISKGKGMDEDLLALRDAKLPIIWVLGGPGAGKATQCTKLAEKYGFKNIITGELLRGEVMKGSVLGKSINDLMMKGQLVPRDVVLDLVKKEMLADVANTRGYFIAGFPREIKQAQDFEAKITPCSMVLYLKATDDVMKERLMARGMTAAARSDDIDGTIKKRLETFHLISEPVLQKYVAKVAQIDANCDIDVTFQMCKEKVDAVLLERGGQVGEPPMLMENGEPMESSVE